MKIRTSMPRFSVRGCGADVLHRDTGQTITLKTPYLSSILSYREYNSFSMVITARGSTCLHIGVKPGYMAMEEGGREGGREGDPRWRLGMEGGRRGTCGLRLTRRRRDGYSSAWETPFCMNASASVAADFKRSLQTLKSAVNSHLEGKISVQQSNRNRIRLEVETPRKAERNLTRHVSRLAKPAGLTFYISISLIN
jgi:hypothetical protein